MSLAWQVLTEWLLFTLGELEPAAEDLRGVKPVVLINQYEWLSTSSAHQVVRCSPPL